MNSICFSNIEDRTSLYIVVIPNGCHVSRKKLGGLIGLGGKESKRKIHLADNYPKGQFPGNLSPFISIKEEKNIEVFHSIADYFHDIEHSYPGKSDISLIMDINQGLTILERRLNKNLHFVRLNDILKQESLEKLGFYRD